MPSLLDRALQLAFAAHEGQTRHEGTPYITHPVAVALMLARRGFGEEVVAAALVHDAFEDSGLSEETMRRELGDAVTDTVKALSYDRSVPYREQRERYMESVRKAGDAAKAISIADKIHNAQSLLALHAAGGPGIWARFNATKEQKIWFEEAMLAMLRESWRHPLVGEYEILVAKLKALD
jgi:(p)ppGpp synthase/HD superfamily hydrolase